MRIKGTASKGLFLTLILTLGLIPNNLSNAAGPQLPSCGLFKLNTNEIISGVKFPKGTYQINAFGISCSKVMGSKGLFAQFIKLKNNDPLPKPWRYLAEAIGAPKFTSGPGVGFRVQATQDPRPTPTPTPTTTTTTTTPTTTPTPTPTPTLDNAAAEKIAAERAAAGKLAAEKAAKHRATLVPCPPNGKCVVGNIGPGGGIVFYVAPSQQSWGQYLEVAPASWSGDYFDPYKPWCALGDSLLASYFNEQDAIKKNSSKIGSGKSNTELMLLTCMDGIANNVRNYRGGGKSDWFLPSTDELAEMLKTSDTIADFLISSYWSSTLAPLYGAWEQVIFGGTNYTSDETMSGSVRPVRAFG